MMSKCLTVVVAVSITRIVNEVHLVRLHWYMKDMFSDSRPRPKMAAAVASEEQRAVCHPELTIPICDVPAKPAQSQEIYANFRNDANSRKYFRIPD